MSRCLTNAVAADALNCAWRSNSINLMTYGLRSRYLVSTHQHHAIGRLIRLSDMLVVVFSNCAVMARRLVREGNSAKSIGRDIEAATTFSQQPPTPRLQ